MHIYLIEDNEVLRLELEALLKTYGYLCSYDDDYKNIVSLALEAKPDLILLDINLPHLDGYYICREIRKVSAIPIIVVTSRNTELDELMSMNLGADDFITKPYNTQILLARIEAVLKRSGVKGNIEEIEYKGLRLNVEKSVVLFQEKSADLTRNEFKILLTLLQNQGKIVSREKLMEILWQSDEFVDDNTLTVNVNRLRTKLQELGAVDYITTKRSQGYII